MPEKRSAAQGVSVNATRNGHAVADLPSAAVVEAALSADPLDLQRMRVDPAKLTAVVGAKAAHIRVGRPDSQDFFRVHAEPEFSLDTYLLRMQVDREFYFVSAALWSDARVFQELRLYRLYYYAHLSRLVGLWPIPLPEEGGRQNSWHESAMVIAEEAKARWVRLLPGAGGYSTVVGTMADEPAWPAMSFAEVVKTAFRSRLIEDLDHPKLKQLRGEVVPGARL